MDSPIERAARGRAIGERVKRYRESRHLTQEQLAHQAGMSRNQIQNIEQARTDNPTIRNLYSIAAALRVSVTELLPDPDTPPELRRDVL